MIESLMHSGVPYLTVVILGLVVAVCPCSVAANVSVLTCVLRQSKNKYLSVVGSYMLARSVAYVVVGWLLMTFVEHIRLSDTVMQWIGWIAGPLFILIGLFLLDLFHVHGLENRCVIWMNKIFRESYSKRSAFLLGILLAFAFCPYSAAIYFGAMIPMACNVECGWAIPVLFSVGAAVPIIFVAWIFQNGIEKKIKEWEGFQKFEYWFRKILALMFIITGFLFIWEYFLE